MSEFEQPVQQQDALPAEHADLVALADGSLGPVRAAAVEAHVARSPELAAALARQRHAVALLREAVAATEAPPALRARLERDRARLAAPPRRRLPLAAAVALAAATALAVALAARRARS
jgi:anti-sigma factor RsiW